MPSGSLIPPVFAVRVLPSATVPSMVSVPVASSSTAVTDGSTLTAVPLTVPSLGVSVKAGRSVPAFTRARPAAVSKTLPVFSPVPRMKLAVSLRMTETTLPSGSLVEKVATTEPTALAGASSVKDVVLSSERLGGLFSTMSVTVMATAWAVEVSEPSDALTVMS